MPAPTTADELIDLIRKSGLLEPARLDAYLATHPAAGDSAGNLAARMQADGLLTPFHTEQLLKGKHRGYFLGKYKLIDRIGFGGMGQVFLCEHVSMRRRAALKVLPPDRTDNQYSRERFLREARAAGQLDHPNVVRAFDVDSEGGVYFLVMEYVDGVSFHDLVTRFGPLPHGRAAYYLWQAAHGLAYLHSSNLIHRDIKPANLLVDRQGVVKILDLGLVRGDDQDDDLTRKEGVKILGTADYLAPEQAIDCTTVDIRADVYGLGATAYFLLTGQPPFPHEKVAQKLIAHQVKLARPVHELRPDVPEGLSAVIAKMLAKKPGDRFQSPAELADVLAPWAQDRPDVPSEGEIPVLVGAAYGNAGAVSIGTQRPSRTTPVSAAAAQGSGSAIRYYTDSLLAIRPTGMTPLPKPNSTPIVQSVLGTPLPSVLPAGATHGTGHKTAATLPPLPLPRIEEPASRQPPAAPSPSSVVLLPQAVRPSWRRWTVGAGLALTLLVGAWDAVALSRASFRSSTAPAPAPNGAAPAAPAPEQVAAVGGA